ncbi:hypothetical protein QUA74_08070 [Microcoleus sp. LAD1_D3]
MTLFGMAIVTYHTQSHLTHHTQTHSTTSTAHKGKLKEKPITYRNIAIKNYLKLAKKPQRFRQPESK